jgi:hypothetical protein
MTTDTRPLEIKADTGITEAFGEFMRTFETFKETNDDRLAQTATPLPPCRPWVAHP